MQLGLILGLRQEEKIKVTLQKVILINTVEVKQRKKDREEAHRKNELIQMGFTPPKHIK